MNRPNFKVGEDTYEFKEISLRIYYTIQDLLSKNEKNTEYKIVETLTGCPIEILMKIKYKDWLLVWEETQIQISFLVGNADDVNPIISFNEVKYGLINVDDMTLGEFADLDLILTTGNPDRKLEEIAAVVYRPILEQKGNVLKLEPYNIEGFNYRKELFLDLPLSAIKSANSFFLQYANSSLKNTLSSLVGTEEMKMLPEKDQETLRLLHQQGPGGVSSTLWLEKILYDLQKLRSYRYAALLTGLHGKSKKPTKKFWPFKKKNQLEDDNIS
jgi:hypothetical protein